MNNLFAMVTMKSSNHYTDFALKSFFSQTKLDKTDNFLEAFFLVTLSDPQSIENIDQELRTNDSSIQIIFANTGESLQ